MIKIKLQPVYLCNVLLYVNKLDSVKNFIEVSKNCLEASQIMKLYTKRGEGKYGDKIIPKNLYTLFPNIQTIECNFDDLQDENNQEIFNYDEDLVIRFKQTRYNPTNRLDIFQNISENIRTKIREFDYMDL